MSAADLFLKLWYMLEPCLEDLAELDEEPGDADFRWEFDRLLRTEPFDMEAASSLATNDIRQALVAAQVIDTYYSALSDGRSVADLRGSLRDGRRKLQSLGRLDEPMSSRRAVILRRPLAGRWSNTNMDLPQTDGLADYFQTLLVTPEMVAATSPDSGADASQVELKFLVCSPSVVRSLPFNQPWSLGLAPVMHQQADLDVQRIERSGAFSYDSLAIDLEDRIEQTVKALCQEGCHIIAFPEMALSPATLAALKASVARHGADSLLRFVLAGSTRVEDPPGSTKPRNRSCTLNHRGEVLYSQDKLARWDLDAATCNRYGLEPSPYGVLSEHIETGSEMVVAELPGVGRLATLICEDLSRTEPGRWIRRHLLLDLQYTPVMDSDLHLGRWTGVSGRASALEGSCRVMVVNSLPFSIRQNAANSVTGAGPIITEPGIGLLFDRVGVDVTERRVTIPLPGAQELSYRVVRWDPARWIP